MRPPTSRYQSPQCRKYWLVRTQPLGWPVVPDVYSSAHSVEALPAVGDAAPPKGFGTSRSLRRDRHHAPGIPSGHLQFLTPFFKPERRIHFGMTDDIFELAQSEVGIDRHHRRTERIERKPYLQENGPVLQEKADPMPLAIAAFGKLRPPAFDPLQHGAIADVAGRQTVDGRCFRKDIEKGTIASTQRSLAKTGEDGLVGQ